MAEGETVTTEPRGKVLVVVWLSICRPGCVAGVVRVETDSPHERGEVYSTNSDCRTSLQSSQSATQGHHRVTAMIKTHVHIRLWLQN